MDLFQHILVVFLFGGCPDEQRLNLNQPGRHRWLWFGSKVALLFSLFWVFFWNVLREKC